MHQDKLRLVLYQNLMGMQTSGVAVTGIPFAGVVGDRVQRVIGQSDEKQYSCQQGRIHAATYVARSIHMGCGSSESTRTSTHKT